jgi:hypothetical protein
MARGMRTTVTLDPDVADLVQRRMAERGLSFKAAVNEAIRESLAPRRAPGRYTTPRSLGEPSVPLDKALRLAAELEDAEIASELAARR